MTSALEVAARASAEELAECGEGYDGDELFWQRGVRAVLAALREPTEAMVLNAIGKASAEQVRPVAIRRHDVMLCWQAMIDAAGSGFE